ncbi:MAG: hypothetical protein HW403_688 [Dehalococcoidia bacterium]|nr:hypothetical protein [Dehalococcoidia bacterium]
MTMDLSAKWAKINAPSDLALSSAPVSCEPGGFHRPNSPSTLPEEWTQPLGTPEVYHGEKALVKPLVEFLDLKFQEFLNLLGEVGMLIHVKWPNALIYPRAILVSLSDYIEMECPEIALCNEHRINFWTETPRLA